MGRGSAPAGNEPAAEGGRRPGRPSKFVGYFQLLEACGKSGCPVCTVLEDGALRALNELIGEEVNDPEMRARLVASGGLCNWHTWLLARIEHPALGTAILYRSVLEAARTWLGECDRTVRGQSPGRKLSSRLAARLGLARSASLPRAKTRCPLCVSAVRGERRALRTVLDFLDHPEFRDAFSHSEGLCLPHMDAAVWLGKSHPNFPRLSAWHNARWGELVGELDEFIRKFDYRFAREAWGHERSSWQRAMAVVAGRTGVFGPDRGDASRRPDLQPPPPRHQESPR